MSKQDAGGPAFPRSSKAYMSELVDEEGMTLRDWFAGQAINKARDLCGERRMAFNCPNIAALSYEIADAMLKEREKGE